MFQAGMIKLCNEKAEINSEIEKRVDKIEKYLKSGKAVIPNTSTNYVAQPNTSNKVTKQGGTRTNPVSAGTNSSSTTTKKFSSKSEEYWPQIVNDLKQSGKIVLYTNLMGTTAKELNDMTVGIEFPNGMTSFGKTVLEKQENMREISTLVSMACGKEMQIKYLIPESQQAHQMTNEETLQNFANESDIPFHIID